MVSLTACGACAMRRDIVFRRAEHATKTGGKPLHRAILFIGGHVFWGHVVVAGGFFQHVSGTSDPVRTL